MLYYSHTQTFSLILLYCWYSYCVSFCRSLMAFVCQEIKRLLTYLLIYLQRHWQHTLIIFFIFQ